MMRAWEYRSPGPFAIGVPFSSRTRPQRERISSHAFVWMDFQPFTAADSSRTRRVLSLHSLSNVFILSLLRMKS
ncbi:MAG: hypothetical protein JW395_3074 [Nitrospira sp.]|nr:hypothetical protein [Nitrospira sp.]